MKAKVIFLAMAMLALCLPADAKWRLDASRYKEWLNSSSGQFFNQDGLGPCEYANEGECLNAIAKAQRANRDRFQELVRCVPCDGSGENSGGSSEQQLPQTLGKLIGDSIVNLLFPKKQNISPQDEIDRQNALLRQQEEAQKKEAARIAGNQAWIDLQNIEQGNRTFDDAKKLDAGKDLLGKIETVGGGELELKTLETDFYTINKKPEPELEQDELENMNAAWMEKQRELIQQRIEEPNKWCNAIYRSLKTNAPPPPFKKFNELQLGDVLLFEPDDAKGKMIMTLDRLASWDRNSPISHTLTYLKEIKGKKYFLDNQSGTGMRIISEDEFLKLYKKRATYIAHPVNKIDSGALWGAARELVLKQANRSHGYFDESDYGLGKDMVCSEASRFLLVKAGQDVKRGSLAKRFLGLTVTPADLWLDDQNFLVTPLSYSK